MSDIAKLVPKPGAAQVLKEDCIQILQKLLAQAEGGEIDQLFVVVRSSDGNWSYRHSHCDSVTQMLGRIELAKFDLLSQYREEEG